jgi:hypothetical protein
MTESNKNLNINLESMNIDIAKTINLINYDVVNKIIFQSDIKNFIDITQYSKSQIDNYLATCLSKLYTRPKLFEQFVKESEQYTQTKYHKENLITHLYCVGWICVCVANKFGLEPDFAFELGFFHDIGKPWAKKFINTKKKIISNSKAHAQIGENICCELGLDSKITWCVGYHMCSCCHENSSMDHWEYVASLQSISLDSGLSNDQIIGYANCLGCLMVGDDLGRLGDTENNIPNIISHSDLWLGWFKDYVKNFNFQKKAVKFLGTLHPDNSIIIQLYGHSGFGKSTTAKNIIDFLDKYNISYQYAERDKSYYQVYSDENNILFEQVYGIIDYRTVYEYIESNDLKYKVQANWIGQLNSILDSDSDSKVKIIDTVQVLYPKSWESTLESLSPDAYSVWVSSIKFGYYGFPQSLYGREFVPKTGKYELIPRDVSDGLTWPNINSELDRVQKFDPKLIDIAYGSIEFLFNSIRNYNTWSKLYAPDKQVHLVEMLSQIDKTKLTSKFIQEHIQNQFPPGIINASEELNYYSHHLIRFGYKDSMQIFNGPSRDYRGETILFDSSTLEYYIGRVSLPVFPDYTDLRKDPTAQELIKTCSEFHIVPKFDGSLFVLALIKKDTNQYKIIKKLLPQINPSAWYENSHGVWCFGSKSCMFAKDQYGDRGVLTRITNSIKASYQSIDNFINQVSLEIESNGFGQIYESLSLVFEAIDEIPTDELTVDYKRAFCPFLCWIGWDGIKKNIILAKNILYLNPQAQITTVDTWEKVLEFKTQAHVRLLAGSESDEPEGYVIWLGDTNIGVKLKHLEYYVGHKPYSKKNIQMAKHIEFSEEYSKLRLRLIKFKPKPPLKDLIGKNLQYILDLFLNAYKYLNSKKNWALYWKDVLNIKEINDILEIIESNITVYYPQFKNSIKDRGFSLAMDYFDKRDGWKEYFLAKYLKI